MGFSTSAGFAIIMVGLFISMSFIAGELNRGLNNVNLAIKKQEERKYEIENTDFNILSVNAWNTTLTEYDMEIILENTGSVTLESSKFTVMVDGVVVDFSYNSTYFYPLDNLRLTLTNLTGSEGSGHRLKLVSENGVEKYAEFIVT
jgi:flagellar protein FlaF